MLLLNRRLSKLEAIQPQPLPRRLEEIEADITQLLAKAGTTLDAEIAKYGSVQGIIKALNRQPGSIRAPLPHADARVREVLPDDRCRS